MSSDTYFKVAKLISEQLNLDEKKISNEVSFDSLGADSLDQIEILMRTEEIFNIEISDSEAEKISCVKHLVECVDKNVKDNSL